MIAIDNLTFGYGKEDLFAGLDLTIEAGSICGLLGKNGAGKTTLLKIMAGLLFPREGETDVMGAEPARRSPEFLQNIMLLPEEFSLPDVTPRQYEKLFSPFYPSFSSEQLHGYLSDFEIESDKSINGYSFGQKKKFLLAFGLASGCRLMLLDEPTNGLDIPSKSQFRKALASVISEERAVIISTHQARDLENLIDPVVLLDEGRIIFNYSMAEITALLKVYYQSSPPDEQDALLTEKTLDGYMVVKENTDGQETGIDLETLFNTVIQNREKVSRIFTKGGKK